MATLFHTTSFQICSSALRYKLNQYWFVFLGIHSLKREQKFGGNYAILKGTPRKQAEVKNQKEEEKEKAEDCLFWKETLRSLSLLIIQGNVLNMLMTFFEEIVLDIPYRRLYLQ